MRSHTASVGAVGSHDTAKIAVSQLAAKALEINKDPLANELLLALKIKIPAEATESDKCDYSIVISGAEEAADNYSASDRQSDVEKKVRELLDFLDVECPITGYRMVRHNPQR